MTTIIDLNDLRHSINRALTLGRYQIVVKTAGAEQVPASITLDLLERDDDGFAFPTDDPAPVKRTVEELVLKLSVDSSDFDAQIAAMTKKAAETAVSLGRDDHGAAIPEQAESLVKGQFGEPRVYEFALQDAVLIGPNAGLEHIITGNCPDLKAYAAADWVHVYDRVTRERRTLKRPEPDAVLTGLRDVAADLRGKGDAQALGEAITEVASGAVERRAAPGKWRVYRDGEKVVYETFDQSETPAADPMPPVGPLTSTEGLKAGDVLQIWLGGATGTELEFQAVIEKGRPFEGEIEAKMISGGAEGVWPIEELVFVRRPVDTPPASSDT